MSKRLPLTHTIHVDDEVKLVVEDMRKSMEKSTGRKCRQNDALVVLLSHRQPGGWDQIVRRAVERMD